MLHTSTPVGVDTELQLLLACARTELDIATIQRVEVMLRQNIDWERTIQLALKHRVTALLYHHLHCTFSRSVPAEVLASLRSVYQVTAAHNLSLTAELVRLLKLCQAQDIAVVPYKGPVLAASVYKRLGLRQFADLDILVHKRDVDKTVNLLLTHGYQYDLGRVPLDVHTRDHYHYRMQHQVKRTSLELHWAFTRRYWSFGIDQEGMWDRLITTTLGGTPIKSFCPEDTLLVLCAHGAAHSWSRIAWICDIAELVRAYPDLKWDTLLTQAKQSGSHRLLLLGLWLAHAILGAVLPSSVTRQIEAESTVKELALSIERRLASHADDVMHGVETRIFYFKLRERWRDRVQYLLHHVVSYLKSILVPDARERELVPLPPSLMPIYHLFSPIRLSIELVSRYVRPVAQSE